MDLLALRARPCVDVLPPRLELAVERFNWTMQRIDHALGNSQLDNEDAFEQVAASADALQYAVRADIGPHPSEAAAQLASVVRERTARWFMGSRFHARAHNKPRGYAGDYYTIELLYNPQPHGEGRIGPLLDRWALHLPAAQAVRNRRAILLHKLTELACQQRTGAVFRMTSLGSGPAREVVDLLAQTRSLNTHATCIDIDSEALSYASALAMEQRVVQCITLVQNNVVRLAVRRKPDCIEPQNLIYSMGLFDYLSDRLAIAVINWIYDRLVPGGTIIVGNVQPQNATRAYMDTLLDWRLTHRSAEHMQRLFASSRFGGKRVTVECEPAGVQLFATAER